MAAINGISATPYFNGISSVAQGKAAESAVVKQPFKASTEPGVSPIRPTLAPGLERSDKAGQKKNQVQDEPKQNSQNSNGFNEPLTPEEEERVRELKARDREVKAHERAHQAAGGQYAGAASYTYEKGPDGNRYAVGGEVPIDASPVSGDPQATIDKMRVVIRAALAPAEPSAQDQRVAQKAQSTMLEAQGELAKQRAEGTSSMFAGEEEQPKNNNIEEASNDDGPVRRSVNAYEKTQNYGIESAFLGQIDPSTETNILI